MMPSEIRRCNGADVFDRKHFTNRECGINKAEQPRLDSLNEQEFFPYCPIRF